MITPRSIEIITADITTLEVDAIVNAANHSLLGGGGVDGAIHRAAGSQLRLFCSSLGGCETGQAKISPGFKLKAKWVIHVVGPYYGNQTGQEAHLLSNCYQNVLELAMKNQIRTIAFPAISTGAYGYPRNEADKIAYDTCSRFIEINALPEKIYLVNY